MTKNTSYLIQDHPEAQPFFYKGNDEIAIFVHGFTATPWELKGLAKHIRKNLGWTCQGLLLAGHGTNLEDFSRADAKQWQDQIHHAALESQHYRKVHFIGSSMGASLCVNEYNENSSLIDSLTLINPAIWLSSGFKQRLLSFLSTFRPLVPNMIFKKPEDLKVKKNISYPSYSFKALTQYHDVCEQLEHLQKLKIGKCFIAQSTKDQTIHPKSSTFLNDVIRGKRQKLFKIDTENHIPSLGKERSQLFKEITRFLSRKD